MSIPAPNPRYTAAPSLLIFYSDQSFQAEDTVDHLHEESYPDLPQNTSMASVPRPSLDYLSVLDDDYYDIPGLQSVSNLSSEAYFSESDSESDDDISRLGRYIRGETSSAYEELTEHGEVQHGEDEEATMMQEIADRGPEEVIEAGPRFVLETDEPQIPIMDYEIPASDDETDRRRVTNPPFLTDGRGRVVWSSGGEIVEPMSSEPYPSAERAGENNTRGESQVKWNGLVGS